MFLHLVAAIIVATAVSAGAHIVPIPPSTCAFDPFQFRVPATGLTGEAQSADPTDVLRLSYDASADVIQFCGTGGSDGTQCEAVPRTFTLGATSGTLTFPALFNGQMLSDGDITVADLPVTVAAGGSTTRTAVTLTTALTAADGIVFQGQPLQGLASFTLVGVIDGAALPLPLAGQTLVLSLSCLPRPVPDKDQFGAPLVASSMRGAITSKLAHLHAIADVTSAPDLSPGPTLLAINADGTMIATGIVTGGLHADKTLTGRSDDGQTTVTVRMLRRRSGTRLVLDVRLQRVTFPKEVSGARVLVDLTLDAGGVIWRGEKLFRATAGGRRLRPA
ncbi:MAG TPA: hypothetical protein VKU61_15640 [Candidatus Binatia bacterium]|nr:hypothetical protein [Candidatus Binatia bacterium]